MAHFRLGHASRALVEPNLRLALFRSCRRFSLHTESAAGRICDAMAAPLLRIARVDSANLSTRVLLLVESS